MTTKRQCSYCERPFDSPQQLDELTECPHCGDVALHQVQPPPMPLPSRPPGARPWPQEPKPSNEFTDLERRIWSHGVCVGENSGADRRQSLERELTELRDARTAQDAEVRRLRALLREFQPDGPATLYTVKALDSIDAIQHAIEEVTNLALAGKLTPQQQGKTLYALQLAASNIKLRWQLYDPPAQQPKPNPVGFRAPGRPKKEQPKCDAPNAQSKAAPTATPRRSRKRSNNA